MTITAGARFDHYEILAPLGAGGMGEVYRARDTRLDRAVAIKVLPAEFAKDADRLRRFEQEARATSATNHPNILTVYDIGTASTELGGAPFIVMELLEGEELRARLNDGALPVRTALEYAQQIAAGLAAAHEKGITHRDLKPENLFVTKDGRVKILDFGLAKLTGMRNAEFGMRNEEAATLIQGEAQNPHSALRTPRCLEKKPERRFQTASDLGFALEALSVPSSSSANRTEAMPALPTSATKLSGWRDRLGWLVAAALLLTTLAFAWAYFRRAPAESRATYTYLPWPEKTSVSRDNGSPAISPDGRRIAFTATTKGMNHIWLYSLDAPEPVRLQGTEGARLPFWSPDDKLMAVPVETGANVSVGTPVALFDLGSYGRRDNRYVYDVSADGQKILLLRPLEDATTRPLTVVQNWTELLKK